MYDVIAKQSNETTRDDAQRTLDYTYKSYIIQGEHETISCIVTRMGYRSSPRAFFMFYVVYLSMYYMSSIYAMPITQHVLFSVLKFYLLCIFIYIGYFEILTNVWASPFGYKLRINEKRRRKNRSLKNA